MRPRSRLALRAAASLVIGILLVALFFPVLSERIVPVFWTELRGHVQVDFGRCLPEEQQFDSPHAELAFGGKQGPDIIYQVKGSVAGLFCALRYANFGSPPEICIVPQSFSVREFALRGYGVDFGSIESYCLTERDVRRLPVYTLIASAIAFVILGRLKRRTPHTERLFGNSRSGISS